jgi:transposase-like protein
MGKRSGVEMEKLVEEYLSSGLSRKEFSERHGIAVTTLDYYRQRMREKTAPGLLPVRVEDVAPARHFTLSLANGRRIEGTWNFSDGELTRLIRIAESA